MNELTQILKEHERERATLTREKELYGRGIKCLVLERKQNEQLMSAFDKGYKSEIQALVERTVTNGRGYKTSSQKLPGMFGVTVALDDLTYKNMPDKNGVTIQFSRNQNNTQQSEFYLILAAKNYLQNDGVRLSSISNGEDMNDLLNSLYVSEAPKKTYEPTLKYNLKGDSINKSRCESQSLPPKTIQTLKYKFRRA